MEGEKLKILMTADTMGGVWNYAMDLCHGLRSYPIEVHLASMGKNLNDYQRNQASSAPNVTIYESNYKLEWMDDPWQDLDKAYRWIKEIHDDLRPDIIHFNNYGQANHEWKTPNIVVTHSCVMSWWKSAKGEDAPSEWNKYKSTVKKALMNTDLVVSPTLSLLKEMENIYGNFIHKKTIHNGRNFPKSNAKSKEPFILSAGRVWDEAKNIKVLTELAGHLEWPIYIAGENGHPVTKKIVQTENVVYLGALSPEDLKDWMEKASIYAHPAYYEPFGLSILEAAHSGCALVLGDIATLRELWEDAAIFVDQSRPEVVTAAIDKLINNETLRLKLATKAKEKASNYSLDKMAQQYYHTYAKLLPEVSMTNKNPIKISL